MKKEIKFSLVYRDTPLSLIGDPLRLKQILTNLVNNAIKFTREGTIAVRAMLDSMGRAGALRIEASDQKATATSMVVVLTYWLSFEYVQDPRHALEPESAQAAMQRGAHHALTLLMPYLEDGQRAHLQHIVAAYAPANG